MYNFKSNLLIIAFILLLNKCCLSFTRKNSLKHFTKQQKIEDPNKNIAEKLFEIYKDLSEDHKILEGYESHLENKSSESCKSASNSKYLDDNEFDAAKDKIAENCDLTVNEDFMNKLKENTTNHFMFEDHMNSFLYYFIHVFTYKKKSILNYVIKRGLPCRLEKVTKYYIVSTIIYFKEMTNCYFINADSCSKVNDIMKYVNSFKKCARELYSHIKIDYKINILIDSINTSANKMKEAYKNIELIKNVLDEHKGEKGLFEYYNLKIK